MYSFQSFIDRSQDIEKRLAKELATIRTGKASPTLLDGIQVESYGTKIPLAHVASISIEDARTLKITPWDRNHIRPIEQAVASANLGVSCIPDEHGVRALFPELSMERRMLLGKLINEKLEIARVSMRKAREEILDDITKKEREKMLSEDEKYRAKDELQKIIDEAMKKLAEQIERKRKEIAS